jgi:hypothetical protein
LQHRHGLLVWIAQLALVKALFLWYYQYVLLLNLSKSDLLIFYQYQEYRPRTGPTTGASPAGPTAAQLSAASAANAAAAIASIRQQATQNVVQNLINSEIKPGGGIRSGAAGGPKGKASKPQ